MDDVIEQTESHAMWAEDDGSVIGYMCLTDWECELGAAEGGNVVYPSERNCRERRTCVASCGIVEVEVRFRRIVQQPVNECPALTASQSE